MKSWKLTWNAQDEEEEDRWLDHTCATQFEELTSKLEKALQQVLETNSSVSVSNQHVIFKQTNAHPMGRDFSQQLDSRVSQHSVWFGLKHPFYLVLQCSWEQGARTMLNCLTLAVSNLGLTLPSLVVCESITLGFDPITRQEMESTIVRLPRVKLGDAQRIFHQYTQSQALPQISARLVWGISFPQQTHKQTLLQGLVCSAVFPLASEGGRLFENELFSTLTPEYCTEWQVQCIWNSKPESGPGFYQGDSFALLTPLAIGLIKLKRLCHTSFVTVAIEDAEMHDLARSIVDDAFATCSKTSSPFSRLSINLAHWLGTSSSTSDDDDNEEEDCAKVQLAWEYFCRTLRTKFERKELLLLESDDDVSLQPDLSKGEVHQKVALVRFCQSHDQQQQQPVSSNNKPLAFTLSKSGKLAREPELQPFSVWSSRRDDDWMLTQEVLNSQLLCDMQAFKFANSDSEFIDFLRWYSPKDVDVDASSVSDRMETGIWKQCWEGSQPVPISLQRPMFDCTVEGEKALHWLESISLPVLVRNICVEVKPPENEARGNRAEAVRECEVIPWELRLALAEGDGAVQVPAAQGGSLISNFLLGLVASQAADKREYLLYDGASGFRLYLAASDTGDAVRIAKVM